MKILGLNQTSCGQSDIVFGKSGVPAAIMAIVMSALTIGAAYVGIFGGIGSFDVPRLWPAIVGPCFLLWAYMSFRTWQATRQPANWIMQVRGNQVLIKFRGVENWRMSRDDPQVIALEGGEIEFVRNVAKTQVAEDMDRDKTWSHWVYLEIGLKDKDTAVLQKTLAAEVARPGWGNKRVTTKVGDYPVQVIEKGVMLR